MTNPALRDAVKKKRSPERTGIWAILLENYSKAGMQKQLLLLSAHPTVPFVVVAPHGPCDSVSL